MMSERITMNVNIRLTRIVGPVPRTGLTSGR